MLILKGLFVNLCISSQWIVKLR